MVSLIIYKNYSFCINYNFSLFQNNYIKTSKYTVLTFLPLNLFEQFQRLANFYFLCLLVLQLIPAISSLTPVTTALPLIGVLGLTAIKDAYDDIVSYELNNSFYFHFLQSFDSQIKNVFKIYFTDSIHVVGFLDLSIVNIFLWNVMNFRLKQSFANVFYYIQLHCIPC